MDLFTRLQPLFIFFIVISLPQISKGAFYEYVDKNGIKHFTEYQGDIPEKHFDNAVMHKDKYDYMSEEEKKESAIENEKRRKEDEATVRQKRKRTPVVIHNNQVRVPVTLKYNGNTVTTTLLLDTGANSTVIHASVAEQLNLKIKARGYARTAGGGTIKTSLAELDSIHVGPKSIIDPEIFVVKYHGPPGETHGLLGLDFLKNFKHTIDFNNDYINWIN